MFKKFFVSFLAFAMLSVQATAATNNSLKAAFDSLNYSLSVEWDQRDRAFYDAKMKEFTAKVQELQAQGLTNAELAEFAVSQIRDQRMADELKGAFTTIQLNQLNQADARKLVMETMSKSYNRGASWSSDTLLVGGLIVLVIVAALAGVSGQARGGGGGVGCYDDYVCYDYYDSWGYYWYSDCYYETYCY